MMEECIGAELHQTISETRYEKMGLVIRIKQNIGVISTCHTDMILHVGMIVVMPLAVLEDHYHPGAFIGGDIVSSLNHS